MAQPDQDTTMTTSTKSDDSKTDTEFSEAGDLSGDGGVIKEILEHGEHGWMKPETGDEVKMHYRGTLLDGGSEFDSSYSRNVPFTFKLGEGKVIKGWDIVGKTMTKGEKARVILKPEYAYGENGSPPKIPKNATLVFEMELISWVSQRDVFGDGKVIKTEVNPGDGWERPGKLAEVTIDASLHKMEGEDFRSVGKLLHQGEFVVTLGSGEIPEPWEKIVPDMKRNGVTQLVCYPPRLSGPAINEFVPIDAECVRHNVKLVSWRKIEDVTSDGNVVKKVLAEGEGWERPSDGAIATIDMKLHVADSSSKQVVPPIKSGSSPISESSALTFKVGDGIVIDGVDRVVQSMKLREHAMVRISSKMAFGSAPNLITPEMTKAGISESSSILVEITLTHFDKAPDIWGMSFEQKIEEMKARKKRGNELFKDGRHDTARKSYDRAVSFFDSFTSDLKTDVKSEVNELLVSCHLNLAMCYDRMGDMVKALAQCKKALEIQPSNVKALYRQGCAYLAIDDFYNAQSSLKYAKELSPGNADVIRKLKELKTKRVKQDAQDKMLFSNLFGRMTKMEDKEKKSRGGDEEEVTNGNGNGKEKAEEEGCCKESCCGE